ncbi:DUF5977 domain-containing protein [Arsenicibacter rosenii]|uniref:DUF5977 domain-containing protein n=1 Tax=Arsenicibacter rosenii TaxID=1750698 RepID=A0A1S2VQW9_9BACT|nr:DUF5977 domain-containing protein [Arsenicibacter rosenii]OIN61162.1 hypothetical protein BLX24_03630 [Arsenicibacter rosenii]
MIDPFATAMYLPVRLSRNYLVIRQASLNPVTYPNRAEIRYTADLYVQEFFRANTFTKMTANPLEASEAPPRQFGGNLVYAGASFELQDIADSLLAVSLPKFNQQYISICEQMTRQFYTVQTIIYENNTASSDQSNTEWMIKAGIAERDYAFWGMGVFVSSFALAGRFLTWQPDSKKVLPGQPEFLYFLNNLSPSPAELRLRVQYTFDDDTTETATLLTATDISSMTVYCIPVGPTVVGAFAKEKRVKFYQVWLSNESTERISAVRRYYPDQRYYRQCRFILFSNSLGGVDTLSLVGTGSESLKPARSVAERAGDTYGIASYTEQVVTDVQGTRELIVNTEYLTPLQRTWLQELAMSHDIFLVTDRAHLPLVLQGDSYLAANDDEQLIGRQFSFLYANKERNISNLPTPVASSTQPTAWESFTFACELDANGKRTGRQITTLRRQIYLNTGEPVIPPVIVINLPDSTDYIPPQEAESCVVTPFLNVRIERYGTFHRNNCQPNQVGSTALIVIDAGTYGSEISQADADAKAEVAWSAFNSQAYANQYGGCTLAPYLNVAINRYGTYVKQGCGTGTIGSSALINVAAGQYGSGISQADADAKAEVAWSAINTQAYADQYGACVNATQSVYDNGTAIYILLTRNPDQSYTLTMKLRFAASMTNMQWSAGPCVINEPFGAFVPQYVLQLPASLRGTVVPAATAHYYVNTGGVYAATENIGSFTFF